jgi:hypothetical protein
VEGGGGGGGFYHEVKILNTENKCPCRKVKIDRRDVYQRSVGVKNCLQPGYDFWHCRHCKQFSIYVFPKNFAKNHSKYQLNTWNQKYIVLFRIREKYSTRCSFSSVSIGNSILSKGIMKSIVVILRKRFIFQIRTTKMVPCIYYFLF